MDSFGKKPTGKRLTRIQKSTNFKKGEFQNLLLTKADLSIKGLISSVYQHITNTKKERPLKHIPVQVANLKFKDQDKFSFRWFGHSSLLLNLEYQSILFDPIFSKRASPFQAFSFGKRLHKSPVNAKSFENIDFLLISHDHFDHLDMSTIKALKDKTEIFIVPLGVGSHLEYWGINPSKIVELNWYENFSRNGLIFTCFPARHSSGRTSSAGNETLWSSWGISSDEKNLFLSGDSGYFPEFEKIGKKYGPFDLTFMQIGAYVDELPEIHMTPEEAAQACQDLRSKISVPIHWATFDLAKHGWSEPVQRFLPALKKRNIKFLVPKIGEHISSCVKYEQFEWW